MKSSSSYKIAKAFLIFWCLFVGVGAVFGAACMFFDPSGANTGMAGLLPGLRKLPFSEVLFKTLTFSGIALLCVNGIPNLVAAGLLFANKKAGFFCGMLFGLTLMAWITIQFVIFPSNFLSNIYFTLGILQAITGYTALVLFYREHFKFNAEDYTNVGKNKKRLVVYFSRMGYTKKAAYEAADKSGAVIYEIKSTERTAGILGFLWCGRFGMHRWEMPIEEISINLEEYEHVTICSPIWVFHLSAPARAFCVKANGKIREADYITTHFCRAAFKNAFSEMDSLLGLTATDAVSICCRQGRFIKIENIRK